jgi:hypothetical protein
MTALINRCDSFFYSNALLVVKHGGWRGLVGSNFSGVAHACEHPCGDAAVPSDSAR